MIRVTQTRTGKPAGNCTEAAIASILECRLEDVPDLFDPTEDPDSLTFRNARFVLLHDWLRVRGLMYGQIQAHPSLAIPKFASMFGDAFVADRYHLLGGYSPDGVGHMTVGLMGDVVWDPNPLRRGIVDPDEVTFFVPLEKLPNHVREWPGIQWDVSDG